MDKSKSLRKILQNHDTILVPGIYDALSAKIAQQVGFDVVFHTGYGTAATLLGVPDIGLVSFSEMNERVSSICNSIDIPVIADADTGYGNTLNTMRTVKDYIHSGAAGLILEDQVWPKRCGHMEGKSVIPLKDHVEKIKAAAYARGDSDLVIIARTDSRGTHNLDEAIKRGKTLEQSGADVIFIEAPQTEEEIRIIGKEIKLPLLINLIEGGKTPSLPKTELESLGFRIILYPLTSIFATAYSMRTLANHIKSNSTTKGYSEMLSFHEFESVVDLQRYKDLDAKFLA